MINYFDMPEKGSLKRPTPFAVIVFMVLSILALFFLIDYPLICLIAWVFCYLLPAIVFSAPFRIVLAAILHYTREPRIVALGLDRPRHRELTAKSLADYGLSFYTGKKEESKPGVNEE